jgi:ribosome maturation factor RimP
MRAGSRHAPAHLSRGAKGGGTARGEGNGGSHPAARLDTLERLAGPVVRAAGMDLEEVQLTPVGRRRVLRVVVDGPGGVSLDNIALVSQALSAELDAAGCMGDVPYTLEVTSPGVDRPLTAPRHWQRSVGRMVKVAVTGPGRSEASGQGRSEASGQGRSEASGQGRSEASGQGRTEGATAASVHAKHTVSGRVMAADADGVVLDIDGEQRGFGFSELGPGKVQVEFRRDDMGESRGH